MPLPRSRGTASIASGKRCDRARHLELGLGEDDRLAAVAGVTNLRVEWHPPQHGLSRSASASACPPPEPKSSSPVPTRCVMFSTTPSRRIFVYVGHLCRADRDLLRCAVRRGDHDGLGARQKLTEGDGDVAVARRHVDDKCVELAPVHVRQKLLERAVQHRAPPHDRLVVVQEEPDRHQLRLAAHRRHDHLVNHDRPLVDAEHVWNRVPVDLRVEDPGSMATLRESRRQVRRG